MHAEAQLSSGLHSQQESLGSPDDPMSGSILSAWAREGLSMGFLDSLDRFLCHLWACLCLILRHCWLHEVQLLPWVLCGSVGLLPAQHSCCCFTSQLAGLQGLWQYHLGTRGGQSGLLAS